MLVENKESKIFVYDENIADEGKVNPRNHISFVDDLSNKETQFGLVDVVINFRGG
jgi:hypothetical protein